MALPSGRQLLLRRGGHEATVTEVGAGLRTYSVDGVPVLDGYPPGAMCDGGRGQTMIPWPNRVSGGRYTWAGMPQQLPLTEPAAGNAIHGLTRWANWRVVAEEPDGVRLALRLHAQPGWPFVLDCTLAYSLTDAGLAVETSATNSGDEECPFATGAHPYLWAGGGLVDPCVLHVPGGSGTNAFREPRPVGADRIDTTVGSLERAEDGTASVTLTRPDGVRSTVWAGDGYRHVQLFTGDTLTPERARRGLAVEPMTAPPEALRTGVDLLTLAPGDQVTLRWGVSAR